MEPQKDYGLDALLSLDGEVYPMDNGYWTKFVVGEVYKTPNIPHGIKYSLTLHDKHNQRVLGFDNAHAIKPKNKKYGAKKVTWDHKHKYDQVDNYEFENAGQLIEDFWEAVETLLRGV